MDMIKKLIELRYQEGTPMKDHLNTIQELLNKLFDMDIKFDDEIHGLWFLGTLLDPWEVFRMSLCNYTSKGVISMNLVKTVFLMRKREDNRMLIVRVQMSLLLSQGGRVRVEIPRGTRT